VTRDPASLRHLEQSPPLDGYYALRARVGWGDGVVPPGTIGLEPARYALCVYEHDRLVGCGRVIGQGDESFYLQDIIVDPDWQGRGIGAAIMTRLMSYLACTAVPGARIGLMATVEVEGFYRRYGFVRREDGMPGMAWRGPAGTAGRDRS